MVQLYALRPIAVMMLLGCAALLTVTAPASARSHHAARHIHRHTISHHHHHHHHSVSRHHRYRHLGYWRSAQSRWPTTRSVENAQANFGSSAAFGRGASYGGSSSLVTEARRYLGGNPTGRGSLWCARFMNMVLQRAGYRGTGSDMARSFASYGHRVSGPQVGAIAVMGRRGGGGHVGIISGIDARGNPIVISGNNGNRVRETSVSSGRIYAYVMPTG